ncbi:hypothetical protein Val02_10970 [Virgisporangium aliadipatigenens]|uniref:Uncharacterized protein n=1 Tax=Virgisporangium aliadipatigenens TaxID=741659 RepID=A0A8J3YHU6_9ACTN|nr:hypothetical protein [Virgisporangium aliadipatigenens]GIJ44211.1 hypothetical protein Val02_10970 [Virgisporangium aliadipatigenens]
MTEKMDRPTRRLLRDADGLIRMWLIGATVVALAMLAGPNRWFGAVLLAMLAAGLILNATVLRDGVPVTASTQPDLHALVRGVAAEIGAKRKVDVRLTARVEVRARATRLRRELRIGYPLLAFVTRAELRGLVAAELTLLERPDARLATRLRDRWAASQPDTAADEADRALLAPHAAALLPDLDKAAVAAAGGPGVAARAYALVRTGAFEYALYLDDNRGPGPGSGILDWDDGWRRLLARGIGDLEWSAEDAASLADAHPGLVAQLRWLGTRSWPLKAASEPVPLAPLTARQRTWLARQTWRISGPRFVRWTTFDAAPGEWWQQRATRQATEYRKLAAEVSGGLGSIPGDDVEVVRVLAGVDEQPAKESGTVSTFGVLHAAGVLVEDALLRRGWTLSHPAVRGELVGPDGQRVDPRAIRSAVAEGAQGYPTLRTWLNRA